MIRKMMLVGGAMISALVLGTSTAEAATGYTIWQGKDYAQYDTVRDAAAVCDEEQDGNGVYAEYNQKNGTKLTIGDSNGSKVGCGNATIPDVTSFRICEDDAGDDSCSLWRIVR
ncbi:Conserved putative secreted protein [Amycolatopsis japonica]|uniref:Conserved putative secreted protein n=1 Tax=Amycolatopsis japonica TaxID=208439 RepID=A0A075UPI9_9PSEU|nr:hypothetical protein [Amycolatopsis japonica]AIG74306.1 Conserved putative secreted protein [Amycolatopsis japonica]